MFSSFTCGLSVCSVLSLWGPCSQTCDAWTSFTDMAWSCSAQLKLSWIVCNTEKLRQPWRLNVIQRLPCFRTNLIQHSCAAAAEPTCLLTSEEEVCSHTPKSFSISSKMSDLEASLCDPPSSIWQLEVSFSSFCLSDDLLSSSNLPPHSHGRFFKESLPLIYPSALDQSVSCSNTTNTSLSHRQHNLMSCYSLFMAE